MCKKCIKRAFGREIIDTQLKLERLFKKVDANPTDFENDEDLIRLMSCMATLIKKYEQI